MKIFLIVCLALLVLMLVVLGFYLIIGQVLYRLILTRKGKMVKKIESLIELEKTSDIFDDCQKLTIESDDKLKLKGYYCDNNCSRLAILVHGYGGSHFKMTCFADYFKRRGYDILAIDLRAHGESEGRDITMGEKESEDLLLWINKMLELKPQYKIVLFGVSMGASTVCIATGRALPLSVVLAIEDCGYDNADKELRYMFLKHKILSRPLYGIFYNYTKKAQELDLKKVDVLTKLKHCKLPMLFIHGDSDRVVPTEMVYSLSSTIPESRRDVYIGQDAGHVGSYKTNPRKYESVLSGFLSKYNM